MTKKGIQKRLPVYTGLLRVYSVPGNTKPAANLKKHWSMLFPGFLPVLFCVFTAPCFTAFCFAALCFHRGLFFTAHYPFHCALPFSSINTRDSGGGRRAQDPHAGPETGMDLLIFSPSAHQTEDTEYLSQDLAVLDNDGIHGVVLGLQADVVLLLVEGLDSCGVVD